MKSGGTISILFTDIVGSTSLQQMQSTMVTALALIAGDRICDIACGTGTQLIRLARIVGPQGRAVGVDASVRMERVIQHTGDIPGFLNEALRIVRPGSASSSPTPIGVR